MRASVFKRSLIALVVALEVGMPAQAALLGSAAPESHFRTPAVSITHEAVVALLADGIQSEAQVRRRAPRARAAVARRRPIGRPIARPGAIRRPIVAVVRPWRQRPHYGRVIAGITLGAIITAAVIGSAPAAPAPNVCWYWLNSWQTEGYWDYCQ